MSKRSKPSDQEGDRAPSQFYVPQDRESPVIHDEDYIRDRLDLSVERMDALSNKNQRKYKLLKRVAIVIGATIPFCVTLTTINDVNEIDWMKYPLLLYSALGGTVLALMNSLLKVGNYHDNWKNYRRVSETLLREKYLYLTKMFPYNGKDAFPLMVENVEGLLDEEEEKIEPGNQGGES